MARNVGNYTLGRLLGRGAMSEVFEATHRFLGDDVAIKLLRSEVVSGSDTARAFVDEAARTRTIEHPNVVKIVDFGCDDSTAQLYLVMERITGSNLAQWLDEHGPMAEAELRRVGAAIARGMQAAHDQDIVHRDLKPANIMMCNGEPKVVDFGIAKSLQGHSAVATQRIIGTPVYMAPEQLSHGLISPRVDVWSLGVILWEAAAGRLPFERHADGVNPQLVEAAPSLSGQAAVSPAFAAIVDRCLDRDPGRRYASMAELADALSGEDETSADRLTEDLAAGHLSQSAPVLAPRRRTPVIAAATALVIVTAAVAWWLTRPSQAMSVHVAPVASPAAARPVVATTPPPRPAPEPTHLVRVSSRPEGAHVLRDGALIGVTPARLRLKLPAVLVLAKPGYRSRRITVTDTAEVRLTLRRARGPHHRQRPKGETLD